MLNLFGLTSDFSHFNSETEENTETNKKTTTSTSKVLDRQDFGAPCKILEHYNKIQYTHTSLGPKIKIAVIICIVLLVYFVLFDSTFRIFTKMSKFVNPL